MKGPVYQGRHMAARTAAVKEVWQKQARDEATKNFKLQRLISSAISYSVGFLTSLHAAHWWYFLIGVASYIIFYILWEHALKAWDIPTKLNQLRAEVKS